MIPYSAIGNSFMSKSDLETSKQFGRQHDRVRRGGEGYFWKGWPVSLAGWLSLEKEGGRRRKINRCDPYFPFSTVKKKKGFTRNS
jgi:hypothetical protein